MALVYFQFNRPSIVRQVLSMKRVPLCPYHFTLMQRGELRFSNLSVTYRLKGAKRLLGGRLELLERKGKHEKNQPRNAKKESTI
jgi:hypothetical protein|nr:hypothetical protein Q903MT_gene5248 [Picea sitchensis]